MKFLATAIGFLILSFSAAGQQYDTLIRNGWVVDGSGNPWIHADVGIIGDRIAFVGQAGAEVTAKRTIDATGLIVAPGFIDMLGQSEMNLLIDKQAVSKLTQGITTEITGEGDSIAPQNDNTIAEQKDFLQHYKLTIDWTNLDGYFSRLEKQGAGINLATYVGAAQVREVVIGRDNRPPTADELKEMQDYVEDAMLQGAMGVSSALIYSPGMVQRLLAGANKEPLQLMEQPDIYSPPSDTALAGLRSCFSIAQRPHGSQPFTEEKKQ